MIVSNTQIMCNICWSCVKCWLFLVLLAVLVLVVLVQVPFVASASITGER